MSDVPAADTATEPYTASDEPQCGDQYHRHTGSCFIAVVPAADTATQPCPTCGGKKRLLTGGPTLARPNRRDAKWVPCPDCVPAADTATEDIDEYGSRESCLCGRLPYMHGRSYRSGCPQWLDVPAADTATEARMMQSVYPYQGPGTVALDDLADPTDDVP